MATATITVRPKEFHFPLAVEWTGGRRVRAQVAGKQPVDVCPPVVFSGDDESTWSPEDFFVAAAASCTRSGGLRPGSERFNAPTGSWAGSDHRAA